MTARDRLTETELDAFLRVLDACHTLDQVDRLVHWLDDPDQPRQCLRCGARGARGDIRLQLPGTALGICYDCGLTRPSMRTLAVLLSDARRTPIRHRPACPHPEVVYGLETDEPWCAECGKLISQIHYTGRIPPRPPVYEEPPTDRSWLKMEYYSPVPTRPSPFRPPEWR